MAQKESQDLFQIVIFTLESEMYGLKISEVYEIIRMVEITKVPKTESFVEGVINLRGRIIPVIDLRKKFGFAPLHDKKQSRIIVVKVGEVTVGIIVDCVTEVLQIASSAIEEVSTVVSSRVETEFLSGIAKVDDRLVIMLDITRILSKGEKKQIAEIDPKAPRLGAGKKD